MLAMGAVMARAGGGFVTLVFEGRAIGVHVLVVAHMPLGGDECSMVRVLFGAGRDFA